MFSRAAELDELSDAEEEEAPDVPALNVFDPETVACDADVLVLTINAAMPDPMMGGASFPTALTWQLVEVRRHPRRLDTQRHCSVAPCLSGVANPSLGLAVGGCGATRHICQPVRCISL